MSEHSIFEQAVYSLAQAEKEEFLLSALNALSSHHEKSSDHYQRILSARNLRPIAESIEDVPIVPVRLFKSHFLHSLPDDEIFKTLTSSGTTGQQVSRIVLDRNTAALQSKIVVRIMQQFLGVNRMPMLVIDHPNVVSNRGNFSARGAGILGMMNFGRKPLYALKDEDMSLDFDALEEFSSMYKDQPVFLFGFTFMVWKYFIRVLEDAGRTLDLSHAVLVHSGGWKKLQEESVSNKDFKARFRAVTNATRVHNFYGMVEQVGSIFVECEEGHLHAPVYADVIVRDPVTFKSLSIGEEGIIQVVSALPFSYPGHSLLTEDLGTITGIDTCLCGRKGKTFAIFGRIPKAEARGCSDTFEKK